MFQPDFSSRETVSEISGRGVGLDAVQEAVRHLGGEIQVKTSKGAGTSFLLTIPLKRAGDIKEPRPSAQVILGAAS